MLRAGDVIDTCDGHGQRLIDARELPRTKRTGELARWQHTVNIGPHEAMHNAC